MNKRNEEKLNKRVKKRQKDSEEKRTPLDKFKDQKFADEIPLEDLKIEANQEKEKEKSQSTSQSERKFKTGFDEE